MLNFEKFAKCALRDEVAVRSQINLELNIFEESSSPEKVEEPISDEKRERYNCVTFEKTARKFRGRFSHRGRSHYCGQYKTARQAALAVNERCKELGIPLKNKLTPPKREVINETITHV